MEEKELIKYFRSLGLSVHRATKARGHQGFFMKNRIDVSKNTPAHRVVPTLLHEFAHYIHSKLELDMNKTGGSFAVLFECENLLFEKELLKVTNFVDENSLCKKLYAHKDLVKEQIKKYEKIIKSEYPDFQRSKKFKEFDKYIKKTNAKYLLKYDRVKVYGGFWGLKALIYSIDSIENDFPDMSPVFAAALRLKSAQRKQARISARINRYKKYYTKPAELFARLVEGIYIDSEKTRELAPYTTQLFFELLDKGYYQELATVLPRKTDAQSLQKPAIQNMLIGL